MLLRIPREFPSIHLSLNSSHLLLFKGLQSHRHLHFKFTIHLSANPFLLFGITIPITISPVHYSNSIVFACLFPYLKLLMSIHLIIFPGYSFHSIVIIYRRIASALSSLYSVLKNSNQKAIFLFNLYHFTIVISHLIIFIMLFLY